MSLAGRDVRIGDADRERAMADLSLHYADGRLDHEEYDERLDAIWTARTHGDLRVLFNDLPRPQATYPKPVATRPAARRRGVPFLPALALLIGLSILTGAPFWLLVFPLMFVSRRGCGSARSTHGHHDYRRTRHTTGW